jgi:hypothetical protein
MSNCSLVGIIYIQNLIKQFSIFSKQDMKILALNNYDNNLCTCVTIFTMSN